MIYFRADGNPWIATGHIMRCLSLADALQEKGERVKFAVAEPFFQQLIQDRGYPCVVLGTAYDRMEEELSVFLELLKRERPGLVILDSYFVTPSYMEAVRNTAPLCYIDDLNLFDYPADLVVNYNIYGPDIAYPPNKQYCLGPKYAPLRKEFQGLKRRVVRKRAENVLISTGGTDPCHIALRCAGYLQKYPPSTRMTVHFVLGSMNRDVNELKAIAGGLPFVELHQHVEDMCSLMLQCDAAISAAGTTLYELCACGLPTVTYILADNQIPGAQAFQRAGLMPCAGDIREDGQIENQIFTQLFHLADDEEKRKKIALDMQRTVDGNGSKHLADAVCNTFKHLIMSVAN